MLKYRIEVKTSTGKDVKWVRTETRDWFEACRLAIESRVGRQQVFVVENMTGRRWLINNEEDNYATLVFDPRWQRRND